MWSFRSSREGLEEGTDVITVGTHKNHGNHHEHTHTHKFHHGYFLLGESKMDAHCFLQFRSGLAIADRIVLICIDLFLRKRPPAFRPPVFRLGGGRGGGGQVRSILRGRCGGRRTMNIQLSVMKHPRPGHGLSARGSRNGLEVRSPLVRS